MGRTARERPRLLAAQLVGLVLLLVVGVLIGFALDGDPAPKTPATTQARLKSLERQVRDQEGVSDDLRKAQSAQKRSARSNTALRKRLRSAASRERRLRASLRRARR